MKEITKIYGILGNPAKHSLSPIIHNTGFEILNIDAKYLIFEPDSIENAIIGVKALKLQGLSVTIPFKESVINYIDEIDPLAKAIGSVNTLVNTNGKIKGYNTDGYGAIQSLKNSNIQINNSTILILGNGGSSRAIAFTLLNEGANVIICGRNLDKVEILTSSLLNYSKNVESITFDSLNNEFMQKIDIVINTTPIGMGDKKNSSPINSDLLNSSHVVFDIVYSPHNTKLLIKAKEKGCKIVYGINMLIFQGLKQFELWTGKAAPYLEIKTEIEKAINC